MIQPPLLVLENVPSLKDLIKRKKSEPPAEYQSNFHAVKSIVEKKGYKFVNEVFNCDCTGIPHRRLRLLMGGILHSPHPESWVQSKVSNGLWKILLNAGPAMKQRYSLDSFLLCETEDDVRSWMPGEKRKVKQSEKAIKWADLHKKFWEKLDDQAREHAVDAMKGNLYSAELGERKKDLLGWLYGSSAAKPFDEEILWDVQQNMGRVPTASGMILCAMPKASPWLLSRKRPLTGFESLLLQGMDARMVKYLRPGVWPNSLLQDMAGNVFCNAAFVSWFVALVQAM